MGLAYGNLDAITRTFMLEEIDLDIESNRLYKSSFLSDFGVQHWPEILREAAAVGTDDTLAAAIVANQCLRSHYEKRKPKGGMTLSAVPYTAAQTMGEGEFNRYYARGLCRRAMEEGLPFLEVYRAKAVMQPRIESQTKLGTLVHPEMILADLRATQGVEPALGLPPGPNSGLTLRIPREEDVLQLAASHEPVQ